MNPLKQILSICLCSALALATVPGGMAYAEDQTTPSTPYLSANPTAQQLQQLVAPIALYPDSLIAQILAASTYPDQVVEADRWLQGHTDLKGDQLAQAVNQQDWDPSVKALTEFPSVLANMDKNLSWTSSLGDAYINHQKDVMDAIQDMRKKAKKSGNLKSTSQVNVSQKGPDVVIEPANPDVVYVPEYNPWLVYGYAIPPWPGWYWYPGLYWTGPGIAFGVGFGIGLFAGFGWGWGHWGADWHSHDIRFGHGNYVSHSRAMVDRSYYANRARGGTGFHGGGGFHGGSAFHGGAEHGFSGHSGAFGGFNHGGVARGYSSRGFSSLGGFHGGFHGGGFHGGGGHR